MVQEEPYRRVQTDYPELNALLDDVLVLGFWVQRVALRWVRQTPKNEHLPLRELEQILGDLAASAKLAEAKVQWRRQLAEATHEAELLEATRTKMDERWEGEAQG